ncbi:bifunctional diaminohydroxyphosphoribosylaminopyrimidine deaminase/5-amino-6-(5-phosphoribosylamino)uracil reductase RibD [Candidatus Gracilibacteria bacterium]|nr:bifunctional diaminohydroxyphosphoribosylaminopyrimidine deaminase/5-amino-6-(5-phosphoribosylamino)uracil reductase RibD [Candidatus Gracilibacteria bacterium]MCF7856530.1 bifunctional diaminohydroxyphosphoribosylaminopyrimidine deaminase/5-amino-6-(5-phosphoribosylamino)uracil reductase RibD [Candidatus Gracilibacteria bacterium]MCF7896853.1 bifunctional diaminohydroxyphosphoribosylaminopyrimidine deaminase/5-amino-6-(5-phosphoribosylamino)uracil reductase RibD [Candidatus Gracilibacteria ba
MQRAIFLAKKAPNTSPNPKVGAVILQNDKVVGEGWHEKAGRPHAEILALQRAGAKTEGGSLFVTLEPCHHFGRTPPCSAAILKAGIKKVFIGMSDPNPTAAGGADFLRTNGVEVESGILEPECRKLNQIWLKNIAKGLPFVALKLALDERGSTIPPVGKKWITSEKSRREVMKMRRNFDAVAVGVGTIVADDPQLTVRSLKIAKQPVRIIFDPNLRTPATAKVLTDGGETILVSRRDFKSLDLRKVLRQLFDRGIYSIFLEGGLTIAERFLKKGLVDQVLIFQNKSRGTPKVCGRKLALKKIGKFGEDTLFEAVLKEY